MLIGLLIMYGIMGLFFMVQLEDDHYLEDISDKTLGVLCLICGPITLATFLIIMLTKILQRLVKILIGRLEK